MKTQKIYKITILGATDGFGKWLTEYILQKFGEYVEITITGRNREKGEQVSTDLGVQFNSDNIDAVKNANIIIYCVPISQTQRIIEETLPYIKSGTVVSDVTSIKGFPSTAMNMRNDLIVIPTHPMFGPYLSSIAGQVFVLTANSDIKQTGQYKFLKVFLQKQKAKVIEETPKRHDKMMAVVQGLTHFNMFVVGETMKRLDFNIAESMDFISPIYKIMVSSVGRYLGQNPGLYADIQMHNDEIGEVHEKFLETAKSFHESVKNKDYDAFCSDVIDARNILGEENCKEGQEYTDKIIFLQGKQLEILKKHSGKSIELENIYSGEKVSGILLDFNEKEICLDGIKNRYNLNNWYVQ